MLKNPFERVKIVVNDLEDFGMPYKFYGKIDREIMLQRYNNLTNKPSHYLEVRFIGTTNL